MTTALTISALPYFSDPLDTFARLRQRPGAVLLDSGRPVATSGQYDILSSDPLATLEICADHQAHLSSSTLTLPAHIGSDSTAQQQWLLEQLPVPTLDSELPFLGGLIGYWSYDLGRQACSVPSQHPPATQLPLAAWACMTGASPLTTSPSKPGWWPALRAVERCWPGWKKPRQQASLSR